MQTGLPGADPRRPRFYLSMMDINALKAGEDFGRLPETCSIFIVEGEKLFTPAMSSSNLKGITRDSIMTVARDLGYEVVEEVISRERLYSANEVFFTGTAAEVTPIRSIDHRTIGIGRRGPISEKIQSAFFDIVEARVEDKYGWMSYI